MPAVRLRITGRVQGVFYRANAEKAAKKLGLKGWVMNREDGSVEAHAEGPQEMLDQFIAWCRKGPPAASVENVDVEDVPAEDHADFAVRR